MQHADSITAIGCAGSSCMYTIKMFWFLHLHKHSEHQISKCLPNSKWQSREMNCAEEARDGRTLEKCVGYNTMATVLP